MPEFNRYILFDGGKTLGKKYLFPVLLNYVLLTPLERRCVIKEGLHRPMLRNELTGCFRAYPGGSGNVVGSVTHKPE